VKVTPPALMLVLMRVEVSRDEVLDSASRAGALAVPDRARGQGPATSAPVMVRPPALMLLLIRMVFSPDGGTRRRVGDGAAGM
jgi:hypothetical protein